MKKVYWSALIGPVESDKLPWGSDYPLRSAVKSTFEKMCPNVDYVCATGWGISEEMYNLLRSVRLLDESDERYKKIKTILGI